MGKVFFPAATAMQAKTAYGADPFTLKTASKLERGKVNVNRARKEVLAQDLQRMAAGKLGLTEAEKRQMADAANMQAGAALEAQSQELGQLALAGGGQQAGRLAALQRGTTGGLAESAALTSADTERLSQAKIMTEKESILAAAERQQDRAAQKAQFWGSMAFGTAGGLIKGGGEAMSNISGGMA